MAKQSNIKSRDLALAFAHICSENRCRDVVIIDLRGISPVTDFFVVATGTSSRQLRTVADHIKEKGKELGSARFGIEGYETGRWVLLDYVDCVIHVFDAETRSYYDLELLWGDAPKLTT